MKYLKKYENFSTDSEMEDEGNYKPGSILDKDADKIPMKFGKGDNRRAKSLEELEDEGNYKPGSILDKDADKGNVNIPSGKYNSQHTPVKSRKELEEEGNYKPGYFKN